MKKSRTWIAVVDGSRGRVFLRTGRKSPLVQVTSYEHLPSTMPTRELGADRPGRVHDSSDVGRHAMEPRVDWHQAEKTRFAESIAAVLNNGRADGDFEKLVLVAPPRTLGELRAALDKPTRASISAELNKDLTGERADQLAKRLETILPV